MPRLTIGRNGYRLVNDRLKSVDALQRLKLERAVRWRVLPGLSPYSETCAAMEALAGRIAHGGAPEEVWLLEHPPLYTAGTSARAGDLLNSHGLPVFKTNRGGQYTYHGPGQRIAYAMLNLKERGGDVRAFVSGLETWIVRALAAFNVIGERRGDRVGVWVRRPERGTGSEDKIAALGIRVRRGVSFHGISVNVDPELSDFEGIVPCGIRDHGMTSLHALGHLAALEEFDMALRAAFEEVFGPVETAGPLQASARTSKAPSMG